jgi:hypothetical protein
MVYQAYLRAVEIGAQPALDQVSYEAIFKVACPDVSLHDNLQLADAAHKLAEAFSVLQNTLLGKSPTLHRLAADLVLKFAGEPQNYALLDRMMEEAKADPIVQVRLPGTEQNPKEKGEG